MLRLAMPVLAEQLLALSVVLSDTRLTGWYFDQSHLAAINLMSYALWMLQNLFAVVAIGTTALIARSVGAKEFDAARRTMHQALLLGGSLAIVTTALGLAFGGDLVALLQLQGASGELATRFLRFIFPVLPAIMLLQVGIACLRGAGDMVSGMATMIVVNVVNVGLAWSLVNGWGPFPKLGWDGIALGTAISYALGGAIVLTLLTVGRRGLKLNFGELRPNRDLIRRILRIGLPGGSDVLFVVGCHLWFVSLVNQLGDAAAAAHGVAVRVESLAYLPGTAFQVAAATLAGQFLGARDYARASRSVWMACLVCGGIMIAAGLVFYFAAEPLVKAFVRADEREVVSLAAPLLRIVAFGMPALALVMVLTGALRGAGDTRWPLAFSVIGFLGVRIPGTYLATQSWSMGVAGAWYAMVADLILRCLLVVYRFWRGGWKKMEV